MSENRFSIKCILCEQNQSNVAFCCGHLTTCETCTFCISFCPVCSSPAGERLKISFNEEIQALTIETFKRETQV